MDSVANFPATQRRELFEQTAAQRGFHPAIAEKDFWVCWVLMKLFGSKELSRQIVFKGGTSLSKVHRLVDRFSEDIDLVLNWEVLGYGKEGRDPWEKVPTATQLDRFNREFNERAGKYIDEKLVHQVQGLLASCNEVRAEVSPEDSQVISIRYPAAFSLAALRPEVKLEIGPLASWVPSGEYPICSFAAEEFPNVFKQTHCNVIAISRIRDADDIRNRFEVDDDIGPPQQRWLPRFFRGSHLTTHDDLDLRDDSPMSLWSTLKWKIKSIFRRS